jgi:hypothetical protein
MASEIIATVNTDSIDIKVTVNGVDIPNVTDVNMYSFLNYEGEPTSTVCIGTTAKDDDSGLVTRVYISKAGVTKAAPELDVVTAQVRERITCK